MKFLITKSEKAKNELLKLGFQLLKEQDGVATFLNDMHKGVTFNRKDIVCTNKLMF